MGYCPLKKSGKSKKSDEKNYRKTEELERVMCSSCVPTGLLKTKHKPELCIHK